MDFYLPVVGVFVSVLTIVSLFTVFYISIVALPAAILAVFVQYLCFNLFHFDGLLDTADAFLGVVDKEKTYAILKDSRVGVYGIFAGIMTLILKIVLLDGLINTSFVFFIMFPIAGRFAAAIIPCISPPAKQDGLGNLAKQSSLWRAIAGTLLSYALLYVLFKLPLYIPVLGNDFLPPLSYSTLSPYAVVIALIFAVGFIVALFYARIYKKRLGGYTGDALGAAVETGELLYLFLYYIIYCKDWI
jgi:adenosylcobinamide-GDP ribazoletransferase